jgi:RNAse (barnase) inhibitor barstar
MTDKHSVFRFEDNVHVNAPAIVADVPTAVRDKAALFDELDRRLQFPDYFGGNWDALWECICDLSWLPHGPVVVRHKDLPLAGDVASAKIYLSILHDAVQQQSRSEHHCLVVVFPPKTRDQIAWLLRSAAHERAKQ